MKFTIETEKLKSALEICSVAMMGRPTLPILSNVKIEALDGRIILSTTNLEIYAKQRAEAKVSSDGAVTVAFDLFSRLVARITASKITITEGKNLIDFKGGDVTAVIETLSADEFPEQLKQKGDPKKCEASDILKPFSMLRHAICQDESRYTLQGIQLSPVEGQTEFAATEGHVICRYQGEQIATEEAIVPDDFVNAFLKIRPAGSIAVLISDGAIKIESENTFLQGKLIEGQYPNWRQAVPERSEQALSCGRKPLIDALKTCALFTNSQIPGLYLAGKRKEVEVSLPGKATANVLGTELDRQPDISIRLNANFLIETLNVLDEDDVRIQCRKDAQCVMIEEGKFTAVILLLLKM